jgi:hypothetical protein
MGRESHNNRETGMERNIEGKKRGRERTQKYGVCSRRKDQYYGSSYYQSF